MQLLKDVVVVGGGIGGLFIAQKLSALGVKVLVVENQSTLASGPSTRNGGKLHRGTFHAALIDDEERALQTARRCIYGYDQIQAFAPESLDVASMPNFAVIQNDAFAERALRRWDEINVVYKPVTHAEFTQIVPGVEKSYARHIFRVLDAPINYRMLFQKLVAVSERAGCGYLLNAELVPEAADSHRAKIYRKDSNEVIDVEAKLYIYATGYNSREVLNTYFPDKVKLRLWKSHALIFPRFTTNGFFSIEAGLPSVMPQGSYSIVCQSQEDTLMDKPNFEVDAALQKGVFNALLNVMPSVKQFKHVYHPTACMKPDVIYAADPARTVNVEIHRLSQSAYLALPGKATEVPYLVDELVRTIYDQLADARIAPRSGEKYRF